MLERFKVLSERTKWLLMAGLTAGTLVLLLVAVEGAVRIRHAMKYGTAQTVEDLYVVDPETKLRVPIAGKIAGPIAINSLGFRGPEIATPKEARAIRIAFLGASTTFCAEVSSNDASWPHLVTTAIAQRVPDRRFDYVNAAVPGYTVSTLHRTLVLRVAPLEPDIIVIYEAANNLSRELRELAVEQHVLQEVKLPERSWLARHSLLSELVEKNLRIRGAQNAAAQGSGRLEIEPSRLGERYRRDLLELVLESKKRAKLVAIATFSVQPRATQTEEQQQRAAQSAFFYMPFMTTKSLIAAYARYNAVVREVARETGILLIENEDSIPGDGVHFADTVHFTDAGSARMAQRVTQALADAPSFRRLIASPSDGNLQHQQPLHVGPVGRELTVKTTSSGALKPRSRLLPVRQSRSCRGAGDECDLAGDAQSVGDIAHRHTPAVSFSDPVSPTLS
jgi:lysophospholipase L1-like esterase